MTIYMIILNREEKSAVKCVADWSKKCLKGFQRQLVQIMLSGGARNIRERCSADGTKVGNVTFVRLGLF